MLSKLQLTSKAINKVIGDLEDNKEILIKVMEELGYLIDATVVYVNDKYKDRKLNSELKIINKFKANVTLNNSKLKNYNCMVLPIYLKSTRLGTILAYSKNRTFVEEDILIMELMNTVITLIIKQINKEEEKEVKVAKGAIATLSYSELESVFYVFDELDGNEGLLIASKVADSAGITRSVIGNAIRKLESSGVIETRSLGMKGTFIKIVNSKIMEEINKIRL